MNRAHSELQVTDFQVVIDSREQTPFILEVALDDEIQPLRTVKGSLKTGDYSILGAEDIVTVERKSLDDLISCIGTGRDRFEAEMQRILAHPARCVIVEAPISCLQLGQWRSQVKPNAAIGSVMGWMEKGVPFIFANDRSSAALYCARFLYVAARRRWRELAAFRDTLKIAGGDK